MPSSRDAPNPRRRHRDLLSLCLTLVLCSLISTLHSPAAPATEGRLGPAAGGGAADWGRDVSISSEDSLVENARLDFDPDDGTLYAGTWHRSVDDREHVTVFGSGSCGFTWQPVATESYLGWDFADVDFVYCGGFFAAAAAGSHFTRPRLFVDLCDVKHGGAWSYPPLIVREFTGTMRSVSLATDYDDFPETPRLYLVIHMSQSLRFWRSIDMGWTWVDHAVLDSGAVRLPDVTYGWNSDGGVYVCYGKGDSVFVALNDAAGSADGWHLRWRAFAAGDSANTPTIAAFGSAVQLVFDRRVPETGRRVIEARSSTDGGATWRGAQLTDGSEDSFHPGLTARGGTFRLVYLDSAPAGAGVVYRECLEAATGAWTSAVRVNDHDPWPAMKRPSVEPLPGVEAGVLYAAGDDRRVWADVKRAPWVSAPDAAACAARCRLAAIANPVRGALDVGFTLYQSCRTRIEVFDIGGRRVATFVDAWLGPGLHHAAWSPGRRPSGLYFMSLTAGAGKDTQKIVLVQ